MLGLKKDIDKKSGLLVVPLRGLNSYLLETPQSVQPHKIHSHRVLSRKNMTGDDVLI